MVPVADRAPTKRLFAEAKPSPDEVRFSVDNTSDAYYNSPYYLHHKNRLQPIPAPEVTPSQMDLADVLGSDVAAKIQREGKITFHVVGDTGAAKHGNPSTEAHVADAMAADLKGHDAPSFFFHLGDVVYHFGEGKYYYDQFYEPFREYDAPIFAIPGNHDGIVFGDAPDTPDTPTLQAFLRNFCSGTPSPSPDAGALIRSTMNQPGVYFTLDAPFVSIIGLYSNVLEGPGVISSEGGKYPIADDQLVFLEEELARLKGPRERGERAVVIAVHHPPASADAVHGGSTGLAGDLDAAFEKTGLWPDAVFSGHAHLYQRFTRSTGTREIPYVVAGSGGFSATAPRPLPKVPLTVGEYTLEKEPTVDFGYLTVSTDAKTLSIVFRAPNPKVPGDSVTVDLTRSQIVR